MEISTIKNSEGVFLIAGLQLDSSCPQLLISRSLIT